MHLISSTLVGDTVIPLGNISDIPDGFIEGYIVLEDGCEGYATKLESGDFRFEFMPRAYIQADMCIKALPIKFPVDHDAVCPDKAVPINTTVTVQYEYNQKRANPCG